jgi:predicted ATPase
MLTALAISGYRSLRELVAPLKRLNVITGANGSGKSSLYPALRLFADTAQGRVIPSLAREGGLQSTLWAGRRPGRKTPVSLGLSFSSDEFSYAIDLGLQPPGTSSFPLDPEIKRECVWHGTILRPASMLVYRHGPIVRIRADDAAGDHSRITSRNLTA